MRKFHQA
jgi:hypothetical protein